MYYQAKDFTGPMFNWYERSVKTYQDKFNMLNFSGHLTYLTSLKCRLPVICNEIKQECLAVNTNYPFINDEMHKRVVNEVLYSFQITTAYQINILPQQSLTLFSLTLKVVQIAVNIFSDFDRSSRGFVFKVLWLKMLLSYRKILAGWLRSIRGSFSKR